MTIENDNEVLERDFSSDIIISAKDVYKIYQSGTETKALNGIWIDIKKNEFVLIKGESGCGKTTLLNVLSGIDEVTRGSILFDGEEITRFKRAKRTELFRKIGFVFQNASDFLLKFLTAKENVAKGVEPLGYSEKDVDTMSKEALETVGLADRMDHLPSQLSGGQSQRVAIARAIVKKPIVIFADEPTGNLDSKTSQKIMETLEDLNKSGITVVMVTHSDKISTENKRVILMEDGKIIS